MNKKYVFILKGIDTEKIDEEYGICSLSIQPLENDDTERIGTTSITELEIEKIPETISFLDESKKTRKCYISTINFKSNIQYKCFWDKHDLPIGVKPLGCPIKYIASNVTKVYMSEITKDKYTIQESVTEKRLKELKGKKDLRLSFEDKGYYETDCIFCSFECCMAWIEDNMNNPLYKNSKSLLLKMKIDETGSGDISNITINPAPHWRTLSCFGGNLSIEQFRESFNKVVYIDHGNISIGRLYEDQIKF
jgi:hypothetical protein